jgi:predicted DNA binding CopG/RHH family protein
MKKIMMIAAMMVATISAKAQFEPGTFSLQPKAGFVLSSITGDGTKYKPGFTAGLEGQYQINNWFGLSAGVHYAMAGYKYKDIDDAKVNAGYINIPVMAKFYVTKGLSLNAGVQLGFLTTAKEKYSNGGIKYDTDIKELCNKTDFSIPLSIAYEFTNGLSFEARYNAGLTNFFKKDVINVIEDLDGVRVRSEDNKNSAFMITVGYKFSPSARMAGHGPLARSQLDLHLLRLLLLCHPSGGDGPYALH